MSFSPFQTNLRSFLRTSLSFYFHPPGAFKTSFLHHLLPYSFSHLFPRLLYNYLVFHAHPLTCISFPIQLHMPVRSFNTSSYIPVVLFVFLPSPFCCLNLKLSACSFPHHCVLDIKSLNCPISLQSPLLLYSETKTQAID